jgi:hypothetical protein
MTAACVVATVMLVPAAPVHAVDATAASATTGYVALEYPDQTCALATVDLATGAVSPIAAPSESSCGGLLGFSPGGTLYAVGGESLGDQYLLRYDLTTGVPTQIGDLGYQALLGATGGMTFGVHGTLWLDVPTTGTACPVTYCLYEVNPATAQTTLVGGDPNEPIVNGLSPRCDGPLLTAHVTPPQQLATVDTATGAITDLGSLGSDYFVSFLAAGPDGALWGEGRLQPSGPETLVRIDLDSHAITATIPLGLAADVSVLGFAIPGGGCVPVPAQPLPPPASLPPAAVVLTPAFTG